jgi:DNA-directed RNA polymerase subunit RPC12/RpoP
MRDDVMRDDVVKKFARLFCRAVGREPFAPLSSKERLEQYRDCSTCGSRVKTKYLLMEEQDTFRCPVCKSTDLAVVIQTKREFVDAITK